MTDLPTYREAVLDLSQWIDRWAPGSSLWSRLQRDRDQGGREWLEYLEDHQPPLEGELGREALLASIRGGQGRTNQSVADDGSALTSYAFIACLVLATLALMELLG